VQRVFDGAAASTNQTVDRGTSRSTLGIDTVHSLFSRFALIYCAMMLTGWGWTHLLNEQIAFRQRQQGVCALVVAHPRLHGVQSGALRGQRHLT
jgi:hypothetical protein